MALAGELRRALDGLCAIGAPEVRENGEWLAGLRRGIAAHHAHLARDRGGGFRWDGGKIIDERLQGMRINTEMVA